MIITEQTPTNLMARRFGINKARVSWTPPQYPPSRYLITTGDTRPTDFNAGITVTSTASSRDVGQSPGTTVTYWLVALYETPKVVGPVSVTIRGEEMVTHIDLARYASINFPPLSHEQTKGSGDHTFDSIPHSQVVT